MFLRIVIVVLLIPSAAAAQSTVPTATPTATATATFPTYMGALPPANFVLLATNPYPLVWIVREYSQGTFTLANVVALMIRSGGSQWDDQEHTTRFYEKPSAFVPSKTKPGKCSWRRQYVDGKTFVGHTQPTEETTAEAVIVAEDGLVFGQARVSNHYKPAAQEDGSDPTLHVSPHDDLIPDWGLGRLPSFDARGTGNLKTWAVHPGDADHQLKLEGTELVGPWDIAESARPNAVLKLEGNPPGAFGEVTACIDVKSAFGLDVRAWGALTDHPDANFKYKFGDEEYPTSRPDPARDGASLSIKPGGTGSITKNAASSDVTASATGSIRFTFKVGVERTAWMSASITDPELNVVVTGKCRVCASQITTTWGTEPAKFETNELYTKVKDAIAENNRQSRMRPYTPYYRPRIGR